MAAARYYFGQGKLYYAERESSGEPKAFTFLGNCPEMSITPGRAATRFSTGGSETPPALVPRGETPSVLITMDEYLLESLGKILQAHTSVVVAATVTGEEITAALGKRVVLEHINLSTSVLVKDSTEVTTYTEGVDYTENLETGSLDFPATGSSIANNATLKVSYSYALHHKLGAFTLAPAYYWLRMEGWNLVNQPITPVVVDIYKVKFKPPTNLPILGDGLNSVQLEATMHRDVLQDDNTEDGRYFRLRRYSPV